MLSSATDYISKNVSEIVKLSVIEWHCNIVEYSYANHDDHPHLHKHDELLHISFVDNNFYENI
jgi:CO dehydrogenase/acetyl-CoA synthase epsilon subunit